jgi:hypothetical protein
MTYEEWEQEVPEVIKADPVWRFYAYRKALFLYDLVWEDCEKLMRDLRFDSRFFSLEMEELLCASVTSASSAWR